jgi:RNA polymerase sigma-70 factor, ECF subfamily
MESIEKRVLNELRYGSKKAFEYVFKAYYNQLCRYAEEILGDSEQAKDVVENLFVSVWENRKKLDIHSSFRSYLYKSTYNLCLNEIRKKKNEDKYRDFFLRHTEVSTAHEYGSNSHPLSKIIEKELDAEIEKVIGELPPQCKKIFLLSRVDMLTHNQIAQKLDISVNTVKSQIMIALKKIQSSFGKAFFKTITLIVLFSTLNIF